MSRKPRVVVSRRVPARVRDELERDFALTLHDEERPPERERLLELVRGAAGLVSILTDRVDDDLLDAAGPQLRVVANYAVGVDNVDLPACARRGIVVANTPDVLTDATAEFTIALLLALVRRVAEGDRALRRGDDWIWSPTFMLGRGLGGRTVLVVGPGRIGTRVGALADALGMDVIYARRGDPLAPLLARADAVSLHCPLTAETHHLIDAAALRAMKRDAVLVNTARGAIVDEDALVEALAAGEIFGAALDVLEDEPHVHPRLLELENVVLAPHLGSATHDAREAMGMMCVEALRAVLLDGRRPSNEV